MKEFVQKAAAIGIRVAMASSTASAQSVKIYHSADAVLGLKTVQFQEGKAVTFTTGIGSGIRAD